jgi:very-short-patch-repair endonuclease
VRTEILDFKNVIVIRFTNEEIANDLDAVLKKLKIVINRRRRNSEKY